MSNVFLKVDKDLFKLGLSPTEILIYAQVAEYNRTTGDCFMSDKVFAEMLGVSEKTISRELKVLEDKKLITRETKNTRSGKERHIHITNGQIVPCKENPTDKLSFAQQTNCPLRNGQNDLIKDKGKDKGKDNDEILLADANKISTVSPEGKVKRSQLESMRCQYEEIGNNLIKITQTGKIFELEGETK